MRKLLCILALAIALPAQAADPGNFTVLADPSLLLPLADLSRDYARESGATVSVMVEDGEHLAGQLEQGLDAHLLLTANQPLLQHLKDRGLVDVFSAHPFARTQLALVGSADIEPRTDFARHISLAAILYAQQDLPVYVTPDSTYEGSRAAGLLKQKTYADLLAKRATPVASREEALHRLHDAPGLALLLAADALNDPALKVLYVFSDGASAPVNYQAVAIASGEMRETNRFIAYLQSAPAQRVLARFGFQPPKP